MLVALWALSIVAAVVIVGTYASHVGLTVNIPACRLLRRSLRGLG
jgi:uncharacterized membrane protein